MSQTENANATALIKRIREFHREANRGKENNLYLTKLALKCGLSRNTLNKLYDADFNPTASTLDAVIKYMESV